MPTREAGSEPSELTDLLPIAATALAAALYALRTRSLARRGRSMPAWRQACFYLGLAVLLAALISPLDRIAETRVFYAHMIQHLTIGELAPLLLLLGLSGAMLRPLLALPPAKRLRFLVLPLVALPIWALNLYAWHLPPLYELALASEPVHWLEHGMFFAAGMLMWGALIEPIPGPAWFGSGAKATYVLAVRALGCAILGNILIWSGDLVLPRLRRRGADLGHLAAARPADRRRDHVHLGRPDHDRRLLLAVPALAARGGAAPVAARRRRGRADGAQDRALPTAVSRSALSCSASTSSIPLSPRQMRQARKPMTKGRIQTATR